MARRWGSGMRQLLRRWLCALFMLGVVGLLVGGCAPFAGGGRSSVGATPSATAMAAAPTAAPSLPPTTTVAGRLAARTQQALGSVGRIVDAAYDTSKQAATITIGVAGGVPNTDAKVAAAHALVQLICSRAFPALWSSGEPLREVTVIVVGPMQDEYADIITDWYGVAVVTATTAQHIPWSSSTPTSEWGMYSQAMLRTSFVVAD